MTDPKKTKVAELDDEALDQVQGGSTGKVDTFSVTDGSNILENGAGKFTGGVRVATGDVNGDGKSNIVAEGGGSDI